MGDMSASPLVLAALEQAEATNGSVEAILTFKLADHAAVEAQINALVATVAAESRETVEALRVFPRIGAARLKAHPPLIRALLARPEVERANSGLTQAPFAFAARSAAN